MDHNSVQIRPVLNINNKRLDIILLQINIYDNCQTWKKHPDSRYFLIFQLLQIFCRKIAQKRQKRDQRLRSDIKCTIEQIRKKRNCQHHQTTKRQDLLISLFIKKSGQQNNQHQTAKSRSICPIQKFFQIDLRCQKLPDICFFPLASASPEKSHRSRHKKNSCKHDCRQDPSCKPQSVT